jgi:hypothetical protein
LTKNIAVNYSGMSRWNRGGRKCLEIEPVLCGWLHSFVEVEDLAGHEVASSRPLPLHSLRPSKAASTGQVLEGTLSFLDARGEKLVSPDADSSESRLVK